MITAIGSGPIWRSATLMAAALLAGSALAASPAMAQTAAAPAAATAPAAQRAPVDPFEFSRQLSPGWNIGNSLESLGQTPGQAAQSEETAWGNPVVNQKLLDAVAKAGFKSVRIPTAWGRYADANDVISQAWINRVREVIGYARKAGLYVMINEHWDGGWQQPTYKDRDAANARLRRLWLQIAKALEDQDDHVLFAGTNEVMVKDVWTDPTRENCEVQSGFNQVFVDTVRSTGGRNASRWLVVQSYNTVVDHAFRCKDVLPHDPTPNRLALEVHFYDPYNFALNGSSNVWQWGKLAKDPQVTDNWGNEPHVDGQFEKLKKAFVDKGVPVIVGEYGAMLRDDHDREQVHRNYWDLYVTYSAVSHGLVPMYWDNGKSMNHQFGLFNRATGQVVYPKPVAMIVEGANAAVAAPAAAAK